MRPLLPKAQHLLPYLEMIDEARWYSNNGPLERTFQARLAALFGLATTKPILFSSGTMALQITLAAMARHTPQRKCLMPSWTFPATALAARAAGLEPHFADVDEDSWALSPEAVLARPDLDTFAALVPVAPFGQVPNLQAWNHVTRQTGLPVIIDAAASFDGLIQSGLTSQSEVPIIVSLHATKTFGIGEGGMVLTGDPTLARLLHIYKNFGFDGGREAILDGTNGKLSEYHCAVGLAALDEWPERRAGFARAQALYGEAFATLPMLSTMPGLANSTVSSTFNVMTPTGSAHLRTALNKHHVETRQWWGRGCHAQPAFTDSPRDPLPITDRLADHVLGLPLSADLSASEIGAVCAALTTELR